MNGLKIKLTAGLAAVVLTSIQPAMSKDTPKSTAKPFEYVVDRFADIEVLRYKVPEFETLDLNKKLLIYYLTEAALYGRDILWDQNCEVNLPIRVALENIYKNYQGDRDSKDFKAFETYLKQVWFGNGLHHHYSTDKFQPGFSPEWFMDAVRNYGQIISDPEYYAKVIFTPNLYAKRVNQADGVDLITTSANNLYGHGVTQAEVEAYYGALKDSTDMTPISYGLNTRVVRDPKTGQLTEEVYRVGGLYSKAIEKIIENLKKAAEYAENDKQRDIINTLIEFYTTGDLKTFDEYSIKWVEDTDSRVDFINGFIESYGDPLGMTGSWESIVNFKNNEASQRTETISSNAQWFEDHSPVDKRFKKENVKGVSAKVINAAILAGDS